jgi:hypothetical protein
MQGNKPISPVFDPFGETPARKARNAHAGCGETIRALDETIIGGRRSHPETKCQAPSSPLVKREGFDHVGTHQFDLPGILPRALAGNAKQSSPCWSRITKTLLSVIGAAISIAERVDNLPDPVCRKVIVIRNDMAMRACMLSQPGLAGGKERSSYHSASRWINRIKCVPGDCVPKERV